MVKHSIRLPDGEVLASGPGTVNALQSVTLTEQVSDQDDLCPGAVCAACAEIEIWAPENRLRIHEGEQLTLLRLDTRTGVQTQAGVFLAEKPAKVSANVYRVTAYDRMTLFDQDMTQWLAAQQGQFPLSLAQFIAALCDACGVDLAPGALENLPNGNYLIRAFSADGVTGRQLMQWAAQAAGRFARMTAQGMLELVWYAPRQGAPVIAAPREQDVQTPLRLAGAVLRTAQGQIWSIGTQALYYNQGTLQYQDYDTAPLDKVQVKQSDADVGTVWPPDETGDNALVINRNLLLTADDAQSLQEVAQTLYELLQGESYTPLTVSLPFREEIRPGMRLDVMDAYGCVRHTLVMKRVVSGQTMTLESSGNARRDSTTAVNRQSYKDLQGKVFEVQASVDGLDLSVQQDFPGNQVEDVDWKQAHSGAVSGGEVILNGRQATLEADGTGSCGALVQVPDEVLPLLRGAEVEFSVRYRVASPIQILDPNMIGAYIRGFAEYQGESDRVSAWTSLAEIATPDSPAQTTDWITVSARLQVPDQELLRAYLFANIQSGTGTLEVADPGVQILSAKVTQLSLKANGAELSSARIALTGMVSFEDLAQGGRTVINGSNITTGVIRSTNGSLTFDLDNATINSPKFKLTQDGNVVAAGTFTSDPDKDGFYATLSSGQLALYHNGSKLAFVSSYEKIAAVAANRFCFIKKSGEVKIFAGVQDSDKATEVYATYFYVEDPETGSGKGAVRWYKDGVGLYPDYINGRKCEWKYNSSLGCYVLCG